MRGNRRIVWLESSLRRDVMQQKPFVSSEPTNEVHDSGVRFLSVYVGYVMSC